ncbi:MAG TPA: NAD-dependent epimerase/dehydratase family protein [Thermoanaerobaculia bacterium]|nr:NAD-dependent epimerase/dehydratase family protein [Thermoanaerobaculia bacterium]
MIKHALVTGGAGFIGSHVVDAYVERGLRVSVIDNLSTGNRRNLNPKAEFYEADLRDPATAALLDDLRPDLINHHAAQIDVRTSVADPAFDAEVNVVASLRLLQKAAETGVERIVFASSGGAIYGEPREVPQTESHPAGPVSPYGCAKLAIEHYLHYFRVVKGLSSVALRYANVYGPRQSSRGEAGVIAIFADHLLRDDEATIFGSGAQSRDFVYVGDVVAANMTASFGGMSGSYNVGTGVETSILTIYDMIAAAAGSERRPRHAEAKAGEQMRSVVSGDALRRLADLPEPVALQDGIGRTVDWFRKIKND